MKLSRINRNTIKQMLMSDSDEDIKKSVEYLHLNPDAIPLESLSYAERKQVSNRIYHELLSKYPEHALNVLWAINDGEIDPLKIYPKIVESLKSDEGKYQFMVHLIEGISRLEIPKKCSYMLNKNIIDSGVRYAKRLDQERVAEDFAGVMHTGIHLLPRYIYDIVKHSRDVKMEKEYKDEEDVVRMLKNKYNNNFNFLETNPEFEELAKNHPNYEMCYARPKKLAEIYNKNFGIFIHSTPDTHLDILLKNPMNVEICVSTLKSGANYDNLNTSGDNPILVGKGNIRLLFDIDCWSEVTPSGLRLAYAEKNGVPSPGELLGGLTWQGVLPPQTTKKDLSKYYKDFIKQLAKSSKDLNAQDVIEYGAINSDKYYDEGFIKPKDIEWLGVYSKDGNIKPGLLRKLQSFTGKKLKIYKGDDLYEAVKDEFNQPSDVYTGDEDDYAATMKSTKLMKSKTKKHVPHRMKQVISKRQRKQARPEKAFSFEHKLLKNINKKLAL
jgi:hypothetical protein